MVDPTPSQTLAERALTRLRRLAPGNGIEPAAIEILETQEKNFNLTGKMEVSPSFETATASYPGPVRGKDRIMVGTFGALQQAVDKHKKEFSANPDWIEHTVRELQAHESKGWGLEKARVTLPQKSAVYAATQMCPSCDGRKTVTCNQCHGQGTVICTQCQGQGRELCYYCGGRGEDPQQPGQKCHTCQGTRYAPCRFCQTNRYLPCPTCQGKRGTPCPACNGSGSMTQEITVTCGAETHFRMTAEGLPSGLRRGLERIGIANIGKGHGDINASLPTKEELENIREGANIPVLNYTVLLPYAELRMAFGGKKAVISAVGKRCAINGVPAFLDESIRKGRDRLHLAALGKAPLTEALDARAIREILALTVGGKGRIEEVRKLYPFGLSTEAINTILADMRLALNKVTLKTRSFMAVACVILCAAFYYALFVAGLQARLMIGWNPFIVLAADLAALGAGLAASWASLNFSTRFVLKKRFPQLTLAISQKIGKTGLSMLSGIGFFFIATMLLAPVRPGWFALFMR